MLKVPLAEDDLELILLLHLPSTGITGMAHTFLLLLLVHMQLLMKNELVGKVWLKMAPVVLELQAKGRM